ncbi:hypothetical protein [Bacillus marasmi]|nr:hypothetical protein [Bacillus marasmi]
MGDTTGAKRRGVRKAEAACSGATGIRRIAQETLVSGGIWLMTPSS